jgi:sterol O-acyltransferase
MATVTSTSAVQQLDAEVLRSRHRLRPEPSRSGDSDSAQSRCAPCSSPFSQKTDSSSGTVTPIPDDAPLSAVSISHARRARKRIFPTIYFESRVSHFDADSRHHDFRGFFALFWIGLFIMVLTTALRNLKETGKVLRTSIFSLFVNAPLELAIADLAMVLSAGFCLPMQQKLVKSWDWARGGYLIQHTLQAVWLGAWVYLPFYLKWQWTHQVFFTLHALTLLMKVYPCFLSGDLGWESWG